MHRVHAFLIHLGISLTIFGVLAYFVMKVWYPDFFFETDGGWQGLRLLLGVDLVLGPLLTFIVYKAGKPGLRLDLTIIGTVQLMCLAAGVWIVHDGRPLAIVYVDGFFYTVCAQSFREVDAGIPDLSSFSGAFPKWVKVQLPNDLEEQSEIRGKMLRSNRMLATLSDYYVPFPTVDSNEANSLNQISRNDQNPAAIQRWIGKYRDDAAQFDYYLLGARYTYGYLAFDSEDHHVVGFLDALRI